MKVNPTYASLNQARVRTAGFSAVARCTNVNTFGILPHRLGALRCNEASELGFWLS